MRTRILAVLAGCVLSGTSLGACHDATGVPDLNNVTTSVLASGLDRVSLGNLVGGLLYTNRGNLSTRHLIFAETMARDVYNLDASDNRWVQELLQTSPDPGGYIGGGTWNYDWLAVRTANTILDGVAAAGDLTAPEKAAAAGLVQTVKAHELYRLLELRDSLGIPIDVDRAPNAALGEWRCKPNVLAYVSALLDSAYTNLRAGGASFPFALPSGFTLRGEFGTPAGYARFNRALAGKVELYRGLDHQKPDPSAYARAVAALNASFLSTAPADTGKGLYYQYSTAAGDTTNPLVLTTLHLNPAVGDSVQPGDRRAAKIVLAASPYSRYSLRTSYDPAVALPTSTNSVRPIPVLKNEELVLLRAQAEIEQGDLAAAARDVNYVRMNAGGLAPYAAFRSAEEARSAVLYEKRYSLLLESAHRLVDLRAYGRLNARWLRPEYAGESFVAALPVPQAETAARGGNVTPVCR